jgi:hypothetical protein
VTCGFSVREGRAEFWYGDCGIRYINVLDYIAGASNGA